MEIIYIYKIMTKETSKVLVDLKTVPILKTDKIIYLKSTRYLLTRRFLNISVFTHGAR